MAQRGTPAFFLVFWAVSRCIKNEAEGHRAFFCRFCSTSKAVSRCIKNEAEGHRAFFLSFCGAFTRCVKNEAEGHRALVKHRDARAGERHQLVGHQMNEQVRHRAVQALEGEPGKVA